MAVATALFSTGTFFSGKFHKLGRVETKLTYKPRKHSCWFLINGRQNLNFKCFWETSRSVNLNNSNSRDFHLHSAYGKDAEDSSVSNVSEDTDEMFDNLFKKYGKVVFKRNDQKPPSAEIDDDAESLSFAVEMAKVASDVKAGDIKIDAIGSRIRDMAEKKYGKVPSGDSKPNSWTLLDFGDVVIHIFLPQQRAFYNLEEFYGNAMAIELPFENEPPFRS